VGLAAMLAELQIISFQPLFGVRVEGLQQSNHHQQLGGT